MSAASRYRSSWLRQNYDKLILMVILVGLLFSAFFLFLKIGQKRQELANTVTVWTKKIVEPKKAESIEPLLAEFGQKKTALMAPFQAEPFSNRMFVSELRISCVQCQKPILLDALICPFCEAKQPVGIPDSDGDGIPDTYEREHGMSPMDPDDAALDMDHDGFSNLEEYRAGTNPNDANDYPSLAAKLRVIRVASTPFKLRFQGEARVSKGVFYQLNLRSLERTFFVRIGDELEGFKVIDCITNAPGGPTLVLQQGDKMISLVKGKMTEGFEMVAELGFLIDKNKKVVRLGDTIKLKDQEYKVIDIRRDGVLIRDEKTKKVSEIGPLSDGEKNAWERGGE